jgi:hypothetical protein
MNKINIAKRYFAFILLLLFAVGCGGNPSVRGKVTFPDGAPMGSGVLIFESAELQAIGNIQPDGTYSVAAGDTKGIPKGTYSVYFSGFGKDWGEPPMGPDGRPSGPPVLLRDVEQIIPDKYLAPATSGLTCVVKGSRRFDITVDRL